LALPLLQWKKATGLHILSSFEFVAIDIQRAMRMRRNVICGLPRRTIFFNVISQTARFSENVLDHKICFDFLYKFFFERFLIVRRIDRNFEKSISVFM
jgi:hypothetical protein